MPRYIEILILTLGKRSTTECNFFVSKAYREALTTNEFGGRRSPQELLEDVKDLINSRYGNTMRDILHGIPHKAITGVALFELPVTRATKIGDNTVGELETHGIVFLQQTQQQRDGVTYRLVFPIILLLNSLNGEAPRLLKCFTEIIDSSGNERCTLGVVAMKCEALKMLKGKIELGELFPTLETIAGSRHSEVELRFDSFKLYSSKKRICLKNWEGNFQKLKDRGCFLLNGNEAPFADMMMVTKGGNFTILWQEKKTVISRIQAKRQRVDNKNLKDKKVTYKAVQIEHDKCRIKESHLFVYVTDEVFEEYGMLKDDELVLSPKDHPEAFGSIVAVLRLYNCFQKLPDVEFL